MIRTPLKPSRKVFAHFPLRLSRYSKQRSWISARYNGAMKKLGDTSPDFYGAVCDLTASRCEAFNRETPDVPGVLYQSVGSKMKSWLSAPFPQNFSHLLVKHFDRENDGLVGVDSMKWGASFQMLTAPGMRGISHGDMIDLNRQNIKGFDVREFYVELVKGLKAKGLCPNDSTKEEREAWHLWVFWY